ncbi:hypothetical protein [Novosphingobium aureum]|uniref:hypothetical protein n=1 Tax=Novosphingobium aureum TaxID=2792964 RepID=UPI001E507030|nr:hypothetical protein [Novosphingobium aureum]
MIGTMQRGLLAVGSLALVMSGAPAMALDTGLAGPAPQALVHNGPGSSTLALAAAQTPRPKPNRAKPNRNKPNRPSSKRPGNRPNNNRPSHSRPPARNTANVNINHNVNVNSNRHYDNHHHHDHWDDWDDHWHPVRTAATVAVTAAVVGSIVRSIPPNCSTVMVNGVSYSQCGSTWYQPQYSGSSVQYVVVNPPR